MKNVGAERCGDSVVVAQTNGPTRNTSTKQKAAHAWSVWNGLASGVGSGIAPRRPVDPQTAAKNKAAK